jgi:uncharacterized membrane protein
VKKDEIYQSSSPNTNSPSEFFAHCNSIPTAPLPDPIAKSIDAIIELHTQKERDVPKHQRILEKIAAFFGSSAFMYSLLVGLWVWIVGNLLGGKGLLPFHFPSFDILERGVDIASLIISTGVLVRQTRQERFAEQRAQLMLQLNLLSEQKIAKLISLMEELRLDLPEVKKRYDPEAEVMQQAADPIMVLEALQENLKRELYTDGSSERRENQ